MCARIARGLGAGSGTCGNIRIVMFVGPSSPSQSCHGQKELGNRRKRILNGQLCHLQASKGTGSASP